MLVKGKYTEGIIYTNIVDTKTLDQIKELCDQEFMKCRRVRIMADCHASKGCVIGTTFDEFRRTLIYLYVSKPVFFSIIL